MIHVASLSLQGRRPTNQDRIFVAPDCPFGTLVAAVADGLGGMKAGDTAAEIAIETLDEAAGDLLSGMDIDFAEVRGRGDAAYQRANDRIGRWAASNIYPDAAGTTLVALLVSGSRYLAINAGDSRCYAIDDTGVRQITQDHTVADDLVREGILDPADYETSPLRNRLTRSLGPNPACEPDFFPFAYLGTLDRPCTFLLCSDGFYGKLNAPDFMKLTGPVSNLQEVLQALANDAFDRQSTDNISAVAVRVDPEL